AGREHSGQKPRRGPRKRSCDRRAMAARRRKRTKRTGMVGLVMTLCWPPGIGHPADASATITRSYCIVLSAMPRTVRTGGGRQRERGKDTARKERKETHHLARRCWVLTRS